MQVNLGDRASRGRRRTGRNPRHRLRTGTHHAAPRLALRAAPHPLGDLMAAFGAAVDGASMHRRPCHGRGRYRPTLTARRAELAVSAAVFLTAVFAAFDDGYLT